jgi:copper(I)-binding protein
MVPIRLLLVRALGVALLGFPVPMAGCAPTADLRAERVWVRAGDAGTNTGGYLTLINDAVDPVDLVAVSGDCATSVDMHETVREGARVSMRHVERFTVPARGRLDFGPGGNHLMLTGLRVSLLVGSRVPLILHFGNGRQLVVRAEVRS